MKVPSASILPLFNLLQLAFYVQFTLQLPVLHLYPLPASLNVSSIDTTTIPFLAG